LNEQEVRALEEKTKLGYYKSERYSKKDFDTMIEAGNAPTANVVEEKGIYEGSTFVVYSCKYPEDYSYQEFLLAKQIEQSGKFQNSITGYIKTIKTGVVVVSFIIGLIWLSGIFGPLF